MQVYRGRAPAGHSYLFVVIVEHFVLFNKSDHVVIDQPLSLLTGIHKALLTDPVDDP